MSKKKMPQRQRLIHWFRSLEQEARIEGNEVNLVNAQLAIEAFWEDERKYNKEDLLAYIEMVGSFENELEKVSGEPDYPHSLKTALVDYLYLLDDD